jgi:hypothetical protein
MKLYMFSKITLITSIFLLTAVIFVSCDPNDDTDNTNDNNDNNVTVEALSDGDFENWKIQTEGEVSWEVPESGWWGSLNMLATLGGPLTMTKTTDAFSGNFAVQLETLNWGDDFPLPGIITAGYFDPEKPISENLVLGRAFDKTPTMMSGYLKYFPVEQDTMVIYTNLTRFNPETGVRDTIAEGDFTSFDSITEYTKFEVFYDYYITDTEPDTINVIFLTSVSGQQFLGHVGSKLIIDKVEMVLPNE